MGLLGKLFGGGEEKQYPTLEPDHAVAKQIEGVKSQLEELGKKVKDPIEVIPAPEKTYVFVGNPPKSFGVAWIHEGKLYTLKNVATEKNLSPASFQIISDKLRDAYKNNESAERFSTTIGNRKLTVTPSSSLKSELDQIVSQIAS